MLCFMPAITPSWRVAPTLAQRLHSQQLRVWPGVQCGWYLTVANLGDSRALLDTGAAVTQVTVDHRVATQKGERARLEMNNVLVAPIASSGESAP